MYVNDGKKQIHFFGQLILVYRDINIFYCHAILRSICDLIFILKYPNLCCLYTFSFFVLFYLEDFEGTEPVTSGLLASQLKSHLKKINYSSLLFFIALFNIDILKLCQIEFLVSWKRVVLSYCNSWSDKKRR